MIGTKPQAHPRDEWAGILNISSEFSVHENGDRRLPRRFVGA
jgi:hypothetical protein